MTSITYEIFKNDFTIEKTLGSGTCSHVYQIKHNITSIRYAYKKSSYNHLDDLNQAYNQVQVMTGIDDPRIVKLHFFYSRESNYQQYEFGMIIDLCWMSLATQIKHKNRNKEYYTNEEVKYFIKNMVELFAKMQKKVYLHRDIKPDNILITKDNCFKKQWKLADFGFSIVVNYYTKTNIAGTFEYASPKIAVKFKESDKVINGNNFKDDVYSFGKTTLEMMMLKSKIVVNSAVWDKLKPRYEKNIVQLVRMMLEENQQKRPDFLILLKKMKDESLCGFTRQNQDQFYNLSQKKSISLSSKRKKTNSITKKEDSIITKEEQFSAKLDKTTWRNRVIDLNQEQTIKKVNKKQKNHSNTKKGKNVVSKSKSNQSNSKSKSKEPKKPKQQKQGRETRSTKQKKQQKGKEVKIQQKVETLKKTDLSQSVLTTISESPQGTNKSKVEQKKEPKPVKTTKQLEESVFSIIQSEQFIFLGLVGKFGIYLISYDKMFKIRLNNKRKAVTVMQIDNLEKYLYICTIDNTVFKIDLAKSMPIVRCQWSKKVKKNEKLILDLDELTYSKYTLKKSVSCIDIAHENENENDKRQTIVTLGHYDGTFSFLGNDEEQSWNSGEESITSIKYFKQSVYTANNGGIFKRFNFLRLNLIGKKPIESDLNLIKDTIKNRKYFYKCNSPITDFEIIEDCKDNKSIKVELNKYLASLMAMDGYIHVVSKRMECLRMIKMSHSSILCCFFKPDEKFDFGFDFHVVDNDGVVINSKMETLEKCDIEEISCFTLNKYGFVFGSFNGEIQILNHIIDKRPRA